MQQYAEYFVLFYISETAKAAGYPAGEVSIYADNLQDAEARFRKFFLTHVFVSARLAGQS